MHARKRLALPHASRYPGSSPCLCSALAAVPVLFAYSVVSQYSVTVARNRTSTVLSLHPHECDVPAFLCLQVCAVGFNCLAELVQHGANGLVFQTSEQLAVQLCDTLRGFPNSAALRDLAANVAADKVR